MDLASSPLDAALASYSYSNLDHPLSGSAMDRFCLMIFAGAWCHTSLATSEPLRSETSRSGGNALLTPPS